jgi:hypothetical protein
MPNLRFEYDEAIDRGARIDGLLQEIHSDYRARAEAAEASAEGEPEED